MEYILTILTNGRTTYFERAIHAFAQHVSPAPSAIMVMDDGGQTGYQFVTDTIAAAFHGRPDAPREPAVYEDSPSPLGMCGAYSRTGAAAAASDLPWAFHLEDDQVLLRPTDLRDVARVLDRNPHLSQMALVRTPWGREVEHGGYIPQFPGWYGRKGGRTYVCADCEAPAERYQSTCASCDSDRVMLAETGEWIETTRNWATSPALFRTDLAREFPWGAEPGCETEIGPRIIAAWGPDTRFGLWGWGEPWVAHVGVERQPGAKGY